MSDDAAANAATDAQAMQAAIAEATGGSSGSGQDVAGAIANESTEATTGSTEGGAEAEAAGAPGGAEGASAGDEGATEAEDGADVSSDTGAAADDAGDGADADEDSGDEGETGERSVDSKFAEIRRKERRVARQEEALELREQQALAKEKQLFQLAEKYGSQFDAFERDPLAFLKGYCEARNQDVNKVLTQVNQQALGLSKGELQRNEPREDPRVSEVAQRQERLELGLQVSRALTASAEKFPLLAKADPLETEEQAVGNLMRLRKELGRAPTAEEVFAPLEERLQFQQWKAQQSARGSAPKANPATASSGAVSGRGNGETPAGQGSPDAQHGSGAEAANPRRGGPRTISNADAATRTGAHVDLSMHDALREAVAEGVSVLTQR